MENPPILSPTELPVKKEKPQTIEEYLEWAKIAVPCDFTHSSFSNLYNANLNNAYNAISDSDFIKGLDDKLAEWEGDYTAETGSQLLMDTSGLSLLKKPVGSALDKSFRKNVLWNNKYPSPPKAGWVNPDNIFEQFNDVIRGTLVCKFIDGPEFLIKKLSEYADSLSLLKRSYSQERDEGYYAMHFYVTFEVDLLNKQLDNVRTNVQLEIQLTTQLQDILETLTHPFYQQARLAPTRDDKSWKWEYHTGRFKASYLSHTLHLLEAIILELRKENNDKHTDRE